MVVQNVEDVKCKEEPQCCNNGTVHVKGRGEKRKSSSSGNGIVNMAASSIRNHVTVVDVHQLASVVRNNIDSVLIIDSRSFLEFNTCHIIGAVNVYCSKIVKRRLQQDKVSITELLIHTCQWEIDESCDVVVYDQGSLDVAAIPADSFVAVLLKKLLPVFRSVNLVKGGFLEFQAAYPNLCEDKARKCTPLTSLSQPCLPITNQGPTRILPFLYLGSQHDALNQELLKNHNITYELNVSTNCPKPDFIQDAHFMRIPVNDNYSEKLFPHFPKTFRFLDKVRQAGGCVLVHCLAGISRSPTIAIAYVMRHLRMSSDDAYRYVKSKRATISPNFNFLGQLLEYEKQLRREKVLDSKPEVSSAPPLSSSQKRLCIADMRASRNLTLNIFKATSPTDSSTALVKSGDQSPTTALAKLSFSVDEQQNNEVGNVGDKCSQMTIPAFGKHELTRSRSLNYGDDWLERAKSGGKREETIEAARRMCERKVPQSFVIRKSCEGETSEVAPCQALLGPSVSIGEEKSDTDAASENLSQDTVASVETSKSGLEEACPFKTSPWSVESLPISSLKELNFTPCHTSSSSSSADTSHEGTPDRPVKVEHNITALRTLERLKSRSSSYTCTVTESKQHEISSLRTVHLQHTLSEGSADLNAAASRDNGMHWYIEGEIRSEFPSLQRSTVSRSDSVCTSGLGSEASESSFGDCFSSIEGCFDSELDDAVFKKPLASPLQTTWDGKKSEGAQHLLTNTLQVGSTLNKKSIKEAIQSPVSPSEWHFMEDFEDPEQTQENVPRIPTGEKSIGVHAIGFTLWEPSQSLGITDSGILLSPSYAVDDCESKPPSLFLDSSAASKGAKMAVGKEDATSRKIVLSEMPSQNVNRSSLSNLNCEMVPEDLSVPLPNSADVIGCFNWPKAVSGCGKATTPDSEVQPFGKSATALKSDGLYRAQSCPGIVGWLRATTPPSGDMFKLPLTSRISGDKNAAAPLRKRSNNQADRASKYRNRYSCGSLDYTAQKHASDNFTYESCPDALHCGGCQKSSNPSTPDSGSSLSPSHRVFQQNVSMIQVS